MDRNTFADKVLIPMIIILFVTATLYEVYINTVNPPKRETNNTEEDITVVLVVNKTIDE